MNRKSVLYLVGLTFLLLIFIPGLVAAQTGERSPVGWGFTYQGLLKSNDDPYTGLCDLRFSLFDALSGGTQVGSTLTLTNIAVNQGYFTVLLDFGPEAFTGEARWLKIEVRCPAGSGEYTELTPRQALTATPFALYALSSPWSGLTGVPAGFLDGIDDDTTYTAGSGLSLAGTEFSADTGVVQARVSGVCGSGYAIRAIGTNGTVTCEPVSGGGDGWALTGNAGTTPGTNFLGTTDNKALEIKVNGLRALRLEPHPNSPNLIGGSPYNLVTAGVFGAFIGGGGGFGYGNEVTDHYGVIGGGSDNQAGNNNTALSDAYYATVGGGFSNTASGGWSTVGGGYFNTASSYFSTVGGGRYNAASGYESSVGGGGNNTASGNYSTVGGGNGNIASGYDSSVGGGGNNIASGYGSTVPGGYSNTALGDYSFAAGARTKANNQGCFVWGDSTFTFGDVTCNNDNRWVARASGGVYFYTNAGLSTGSYLAAGSGSWASMSDKHLKENIELVDEMAVLEALVGVPIATWNYTTQDESIRHIGPMAQDFYTAFGVGENDTTITTIDADGVALAAIQGLYAENQALKAQVETLQQDQADLESRLSALEEALQTGQSSTQANTGLSWVFGLGLVVITGVWALKQRREGAL
ncbi:MAG: tail fiber domain-containing protein [Brevefilum sp.]